MTKSAKDRLRKISPKPQSDSYAQRTKDLVLNISVGTMGAKGGYSPKGVGRNFSRGFPIKITQHHMVIVCSIVHVPLRVSHACSKCRGQ